MFLEVKVNFFSKKMAAAMAYGQEAAIFEALVDVLNDFGNFKETGNLDRFELYGIMFKEFPLDFKEDDILEYHLKADVSVDSLIENLSAPELGSIPAEVLRMLPDLEMKIGSKKYKRGSSMNVTLDITLINASNPKLSPTFSFLLRGVLKHKKYLSAITIPYVHKILTDEMFFGEQLSDDDRLGILRSFDLEKFGVDLNKINWDDFYQADSVEQKRLLTEFFENTDFVIPGKKSAVVSDDSLLIIRLIDNHLTIEVDLKFLKKQGAK